MGEIIQEAIKWHNLPLTGLLGIIGAYWLMVAFGLVDSEWMDADLDVDLDVDLDADLDAGLEVDADADVDHGADGMHVSKGNLGDLGIPLLKFVNAHEVPITIVVSLMSLFLWAGSMILNKYLNPGAGALLAGGFFAASLVGSAILTRIVTSPLIPLMRGLKRGANEEVKVVGQVGSVKTGEITERHGQLEIDIGGSPILVQARVREGAPALLRGEQAMVVDHEADTEIYTVRRLEPINTEAL